MNVLRGSDDLLLLEVPIEVIECLLKDLIRCSEGWFVGDGVDCFLLDLHQDPF